MSGELISVDKKSVKQQLNNFFKNTKAHGFKQMSKSKNRLPLKIIWIIFLIFLLLIFAYNFYIITVTYLQVPLSTTFSYTDIYKEWPSITFCQDNPFLYVDNASNFVPFYNSSVSNLRRQMESFWNNSFPNQRNRVIATALSSIYPFGVKYYGFMDIFTPLLTCISSDPYDCPTFSYSSLFYFNGAICATMNPINTTNTYDSLNFIYIFMSSSTEFIQPDWPMWFTFLSLYIHPLNTFPSGIKYSAMDTFGRFLINIKRNDITTDSTSILQCLENPPNLNITDLNGSIQTLAYSKDLCTMLETQKQLMISCGCLSETLAIPEKYSKNFGTNFKIFCHHLDMTDLGSKSQLLSNTLSNRMTCHDNVINNNNNITCYQPCQRTTYRGSSDFQEAGPGYNFKLAVVNKISLLKDTLKLQYFNSQFCLLNEFMCNIYKNNILKIIIQLKIETGSSIQTVTYGLMNYLSDTAGIVGLYAGYSLLTVLEFVDFMVVASTNLVL